MSEERSWVLLVSLGPVQDFIASARRCQDLWYGSWLLSALSLATARAIAAGASEGADALVFPGGLAQRSLDRTARAEVANKIVAVVAGKREDVRSVVTEAERAMRGELTRLSGEAFDPLTQQTSTVGAVFHRTVAEQQVHELIEFLWVAVPIAEGGYRAARSAAERLLAARKNSRQWQQPPWSRAGVPKSSLDGQRESVLDESLYAAPGRAARVDDDQRRQLFAVQGAERLCGVSLLKRLGRRPASTTAGAASPRRRRFYSTSHLAALPWMLGLARTGATEVEGAWTRLRNTLDATCPSVLDELQCAPFVDAPVFGTIDGQLFFEQRLRESLEDHAVDRGAHERSLEALRTFLRAVGASEPQPYYAILLADGDRMGRVIDHHDRAAHTAISAALVEFARSAEAIVRNHHGSLVYSGGDDVLALLPVHTAIACAQQLAKDFETRLKAWTDATGQSPTLSAGIAVVHHLAPLDESLSTARRAEKLAKIRRDSLAVIVDKRAGAAVETSGPWSTFVPAIEQVVQWHLRGAIAARAGHELAAVARLTEGVPSEERAEFCAMAKSEAARILQRKREAGGAAPLSQSLREDIERMVPRDADNPAAWLGALLVVGSALATAERQANPASPTEAS